MMASLELTTKRRHGLIDDDCQRHSKVEIGVGEPNLSVSQSGLAVSTTVVGDDFGGGLCDGVIPLVGSMAWCWLSTLLFLLWQVEVVDLNFFFFWWNLYFLFLSTNSLIGGNCKDLMR